jgi:GNAT superfamily N-acetyltransferase
MPRNIFIAESDEEITDCFDAFKVLRPHLKEEEFLSQVRRQQQQSYQIVALREGGVTPSAAGFRFAEYLAWGLVLYIDDLTTLPEFRGRGHGDQLMNWMIGLAKSRGCRGVHLDTGYARHAAHRLYLRKGLHLNCHHLALEFEGDS